MLLRLTHPPTPTHGTRRRSTTHRCCLGCLRAHTQRPHIPAHKPHCSVASQPACAHAHGAMSCACKTGGAAHAGAWGTALPSPLGRAALAAVAVMLCRGTAVLERGLGRKAREASLRAAHSCTTLLQLTRPAHALAILAAQPAAHLLPGPSLPSRFLTRAGITMGSSQSSESKRKFGPLGRCALCLGHTVRASAAGVLEARGKGPCVGRSRATMFVVQKTLPSARAGCRPVAIGSESAQYKLTCTAQRAPQRA